MAASLYDKIDIQSTFNPIARYLRHPVDIVRNYDRDNLRPDIMAGITVAVIALPQAIAFAIVAELPPEMGIYATIIGGIVGALWGASNQATSGPANAISLLVLSTLSRTAVPGTADFIMAAGLMAVMVGAFQAVMGLLRMGILVNFVSHSVIVGFATGAGVLILIKQIPPLLGVSFSASGIAQTLVSIVVHIPNLNPSTTIVGVVTMITIMLIYRFRPKWPAALISMLLATSIVYSLNLVENGVAVIGELPKGLPPLADLPLFDLQLIAELSSGALAVGAIGLVQTMAIVRSISTQTGQRVDSNQEFVGQGLANIASGFFSGYPGAASFSRSVVNVDSGARSPLASVFSSLFVLLALWFFGAVTAYLPQTALAGILIITAYRMIDHKEIIRIARGTLGDAMIMLATLFGTIFLNIEFAVLMGILFSFARYILRTSMPQVMSVLPSDRFRHFVHQPQKEECPQLAIMDILGDLYFGAVNHVEEQILQHGVNHPEQRFLLLRMTHVNHCDFSGIHMLENVVRTFRDRGGNVFFVRVNEQVYEFMESTGFIESLGTEHFLYEDDAIAKLFYHTFDPAICIYECPVRVFKECQNLPKRLDLVDLPSLSNIPEGHVNELSAYDLWQKLHNGQGAPLPKVIDVREPREFRRGHIAEADSIPFRRVLESSVTLPNDRPIVLVCRTGRRSRRAAHALHNMGCMDVSILQGGMIAWEAERLLEAIEE